MLAKVTSCAIIGLEGAFVQVEVDTSRGLRTLTIIGLSDIAVQESTSRGLSYRERGPRGRTMVSI